MVCFGVCKAVEYIWMKFALQLSVPKTLRQSTAKDAYTNLGTSDKRQIQNETKTIYCILLIIFCEESLGEEERARGTSNNNGFMNSTCCVSFATESSSSAIAHSASFITQCERNSFTFWLRPHDEKLKINRMMNNSHPHSCCSVPHVRKFQFTVSLWLMTFRSRQQCIMKRPSNWPSRYHKKRLMKR